MATCPGGPLDPSAYGDFALVVLSVGVILQMLLRTSERFVIIPYTLTVLLFGIVIGAIHLATNKNMGGLSYSIEKWLSNTPFALFYMFVPALLFPACFNADYYIWTKVLPQSIILAVFGVFISIITTAIIAKYVFSYGWSWIECLMFGAMFAATDPVATISMLKDLNAPWSTGMIIEGESLLNDGTAFVCFYALERAAAGISTNYSPSSIIGAMAYSGFIGPLMGLAAALMSIILLNLLWDDSVLGATVTLLGAWGSFFLANFVNASGVLAVCTIGVLLSGYSQSYVDPKALEHMKSFWEVIDFVANTMLFGFAGLVVVIKVETTPEIGAYDFGMIFVNYAFLNLFRFTAILLLWYPWLSKTGYGMDWRKYLIISWAGLRGAIGLLSALIVVGECKCPASVTGFNNSLTVNGTESLCLTELTANIMMFQMAGIVFLTLLINGPTTKPILNFINLSKKPAAAMVMHRNVMKNIDDYNKVIMGELVKDPQFRGANWSFVSKSLPVLAAGSEEEGDLSAQTKFIRNFELQNFQSKNVNVTSELVVKEAKVRYYNFVKLKYTEMLNESAINSFPPLKMLLNACSKVQDHEEEEILNEWECFVLPHCEISRIYKWRIFTWHVLNKLLLVQVAYSYDVATSFAKAHEGADQGLLNVVPLEYHDLVREKIIDFGTKMVQQATDFANQIEMEYPSIIANFKTNLMLQRALKMSKNYVETLESRSEVEERDLVAYKKAYNRSKGVVQPRLLVSKRNNWGAALDMNHIAKT